MAFLQADQMSAKLMERMFMGDSDVKMPILPHTPK